VLQRLLERWLDFGGSGHIAGLIASNVIFGLLHFLTPTYALLAGLMGVYFGVLLDSTNPPSLVIPMVAHGVYDYLAFLLLRRAARREAIPVEASPSPAAQAAPSETSTSQPDSAG
jgi:membrane protease YdiL (CAAX protease family)